MRVLIFDSSVEDSSYLSNFQLIRKPIVTIREEDIIDSDLIIIDIENITGRFNAEKTNELAPYLHRRISAGGVLIAFSAKPVYLEGFPNYQFLYSLFKGLALEVGDNSGLEIIGGINEKLNEIFLKHKARIRWNCIFSLNRDEIFYPLLGNKAKEVVSCNIKCNQGHVCLLPTIRDKNKFIDEFLPVLFDEFNPIIDYTVKKKEREAEPEWLNEFQVEGAGALIKEIDDMEEKIISLQEESKAKKDELESLSEYRDLLGETGYWLESAVKKFFQLLEFQCEKKEDTDLVGVYDGREVFIEIEGSEKAIKLDKGRQILQRISDAENPETAKGVLVGNPFRKNPPTERPPENQNFFVKEVEGLAVKHDISLVLTIDMFEIVQKILRGEEVGKEAILKQIFDSKGLIKFIDDTTK